MLPRPRTPLVFFCSLLTFGCAIARAQLLQPRSIQFTGSQQYSAADLLPVVHLKVGQTYSSDALNQTAQKLMALGLFNGVGYKFDGVNLNFTLSDNPNLYAVQIDNLPLPEGPAVDAELRKRVPLYRGKVPSEGTMLDEVRAAFESMLKVEGIDATVTTVPAGPNPHQKATAFSFHLDKPLVMVGDVHWEYSPELDKPFASRLHWGKRPFVWGKSAEDLSSLTNEVFVDAGYAAAKIRVERAGPPVMSGGVIQVPFRVHIDPGRKYRLGVVQIAADVPVEMAAVEKSASARAFSDSEASRFTILRILVMEQLLSKGYLDCKVQGHPEIDEAAGIVNYKIDTILGPVYHLGLLRFDNVGDKLRSVLMRDWQMMPGDPFDQSYVSNFLPSVEKKDPVLLRTLSGAKASYNVQANPETHEVSVVIRLERQ